MTPRTENFISWSKSLIVRTANQLLSAQPQPFMHRLAGLAVLAALPLLLASCGGGGSNAPPPPPPPPNTYTASSGVAEKGPLIKGSTVTAQELDARLSPTGKQYSYQVTSDIGTFAPTSTFSSRYIGLNASGYYFDEVANTVSTGTVTLTGYSDLAAASVLNVNLLTTLAYQRIQHLVVNSNMTFSAAKTQAEGEVLAALSIPPGCSGSFSTLNLRGGTDGDHILAAVSSLFVYGNSAGPLSQLIANFQSDIATNGAITNAATKSALSSAAQNVNPTSVAANLTQAYSSVGVSFVAADIANWIDPDGDGVVGKFTFQVADATPSSVYTFPTFVVDQVAGKTVSAAGGILLVNQAPATGAVMVQKGDVLAVSPGAGAFPNGMLAVYLMSGTTRTARVSFASGLLSIAVTPSAPSIAKGLTQQFTATGTFSDTSTADLTNSVRWTSGTPTVATVNATSGLANSLTVGSTVVTATSGSVFGSATLTVTPAILESIAITPNPALTGLGLALQLTATGTYSDATRVDVTSVASWSSDTPSVATVGPTTGRAIGVSLGTATISATIGSVTATCSLRVTSNVWLPTGNLSTSRYYHTATLLPNGKVLVTGGHESGTNSGSESLASAEIYDPIAGTWSPTGSLSVGREWHSATLLPNGKVLVVGGRAVGTVGGVLATAELYDPATGAWSPTGNLSAARSRHTATLLPNGTVLVAGGYGQGNYLVSSELYDPVAGTWSPAGSLSIQRTGHTATLLPDGRVLATGGVSVSGADSLVVGSSELYDPVANTWSLTGSLAQRRADHAATLLPNGKVLVAGGYYRNGVPPVASAELFDPIDGTWSPTGSLSVGREKHSATLLPNGKVLVAAGVTLNEIWGPGIKLVSSELYDPVAGTWSPAGDLSTARFSHTATLFPNGVVMVVGGWTDSAEIYR